MSLNYLAEEGTFEEIQSKSADPECQLIPSWATHCKLKISKGVKPPT